VRGAYFERARAEPARFRIVDATQPLPAVRAELARIVASL
jgi:thymidylate kinase